MINVPVLVKNNVKVMSSVDLAKLCVGESKNAHSHFMAKAEKVLGEDVPKFWDISKDSYGRDRKILLLPEREACLMAMSYSYELQAYVFDAWQSDKNKITALPSVKELALMVIAAEEEKEKALLLIEEKSHHIEGLESLFHSGGTITQFAKQLNGVNCNKINLWLYDNTKWLYDDNKDKVYTQGRNKGKPKPHAWRASSYARDKYITERPVNLEIQGKESFTKYEVNLLANGKKWLFKKYITGQLSSCMKSTWDGKYTQEKDLYQPKAKIEWLENTAL